MKGRSGALDGLRCVNFRVLFEPTRLQTWVWSVVRLRDLGPSTVNDSEAATPRTPHSRGEDADVGSRQQVPPLPAPVSLRRRPVPGWEDARRLAPHEPGGGGGGKEV